MKKYTVTFQETGQRVPGSEEDTLLSLMRRAGLHPDAPCGGQGKCGKCTAVLESGETVLACRQKVDRDMTVLSGASSEKARILPEADVSTQAGRNPVVRRIEVTVPPCLKGESSAAEGTKQPGRTEEVLFTLVFGPYLSEIANVRESADYIAYEADGTRVTYHPVFVFEVDEENPAFYAKDGKLYRKQSGELVTDFEYPAGK